MKTRTAKKTGGYLLNAVLSAAVIAVSVMAPDFGATVKGVTIVWQLCYFIILSCSLNLVIGFLGQLSLGHCGFMAVGAYTAALISLAFQRAGFYTDKGGGAFLLVLLICIVAAGILAALVGVLVGIPALRMKGDYLAIITLGFGLIIVNIINNLPFCGMDGLSKGSAASALYANGLGFVAGQLITWLWLPVALTILSVIMMYMFVRSKYGRAITAIRDNEIAAAASGVNVSHFKVLTFVVGAFFAGIAGAIFAMCSSTLSTASFNFTSSSILNSTFIVVMVVIGGMGSLTGSSVAAVLLYLLNYTIKNGKWVAVLPVFLRQLFAYPMLVYSIVMVIVIIFRPHGIFGTYEFSLYNSLKRLFSKRRTAAAAKEVTDNE
ncbi:MAG TPA: branched-chain amino acid ABC transporter permease [Oscillospiraceae bacterium]|nr:branched-chain amino acid ABC transporter permease [Oscillospiraceae bacterium]